MAAAPAARRLPGPGFGICTSYLTRSFCEPFVSSRLLRRTIQSSRKLHSASAPSLKPSRSATTHSQSFIRDYFSANVSIERGWIKNGMLAAARTIQESTSIRQQQASAIAIDATTHEALDEVLPPVENPLIETPGLGHSTEIAETTESDDILPHRKRRRRKANTTASEEALPLDASNQLTTAATALPSSAHIRRRLATYLSLSKPRLSVLVILTTTSAYSLYPIPDILASTVTAATTSFSTSTLTLLFLTTGTFLSCACANTLNMLAEPKYDALMSRTRNRPLVRKLITPRAAALFAILCGTSGLAMLWYGTNPTVAGLSALNIILYAGVYTPMKRMSAVNTWVGALVGGIPPLMGWCAAAGDVSTTERHSWQDLLFSEGSLGGWILATLLFAWQFPHFMSLSHTIREDYKNAGHKMLAWTNPARNTRVALRYSLAMFPICGALYWAGYVDSGFLVVSTASNVWMTREAVRFWMQKGAGGSAKRLFWASVWQLPIVLVGALVCKRGLWDGFFGRTAPRSIYEEDEMEGDGDSLGMDLQKTRKPPPPDMNLSMMGFKRPS